MSTDTSTRIGRQFSWILIGRLAGALIQAGSMALLARWIGPAEFGLFASVYGFAIITQTVMDFGLATLIVRLRAQSPEDGSIGRILRLVGRINLVVVVIGLVVSAALSIWDQSFVPLIPLAVWIGADRQVETWLGIPLADGATWQNATSLVFRRAAALLFLIGAAVMGTDPFFGYSFGLAVSSLVAAAFIVRGNIDSVKTDGETSDKILLRQARPFWINSIGTQARNLDTLIVAFLLSPGAAGFYGAASRLTTPLRILPTSFSSVLMPAAARTPIGARGALIRTTLCMLAFSSALYLAIGVALPFAVPLLLGPAYNGAIPVIQIVCFGLIFAAVASQLSALMQGWGYLTTVAAISTGSTLSCLAAIAVLAPLYGVVGAGLALSLSYVIQMLTQLVCLYLLSRRAD
ncbi:lipopolysaccharide biosynthesis protein [Rhodococcus opacus]|uniref:lipopolysaccharide biosynthesis protein n=1 Tax=Rhodococcus opacus TaxID=37919 RepID=UPI00146BAF0F